MVKRVYKFRIYPTSEQEIVLKKTIGCCRYIYNWGLRLRSDAWNHRKEKINVFKTCAELTKLKKEPETEWLKEVSNVPLQQSLRDLGSAYDNFFKKRANLPTFKSKRSGGTARFTRDAFYTKDGLFRIGRVKKSIKIKWSRELPSKPSSCTISLTPSGQWFASFICEEEIEKLPKRNKQIGIDLGVETFATLSDGSKIKQPDSIRKSRRKLSRFHKSLDRKKKGSKNREKARVKLARAHQKVSNIRQDFLQKLSTSIIRENQTIVIEDLSLMEMEKRAKRGLRRSMREQGWYSFKRMLDYKSSWYGREIIVVDKFFPSSQLCNSCGKTNKVSLNKRSVKCECGVTYDRDTNAAQNILTVGTTVSACGVDVRPISNRRLTAKQEVLPEMAG